jgi:uncharacterized RDD family membrane protein YckC
MEYEDTRTIATPEGIELALPLAGLGSRFMALAVDLVLEYALLIATVYLAYKAFGDLAAFIVVACAGLALLVGYDVVFEVWGGGRTLGKRMSGLRVVRDTGAPVGLRASLIRNVLRLVEGFATMYVPAMISVLATTDNQRLGDLAGGTLVVRDPRAAPPLPQLPQLDRYSFDSWDVSAVRDQELIAVRSFLSRRRELAPHARERLAADLAGRLRPRVAGAPSSLPDEGFLERLVAAKGGS